MRPLVWVLLIGCAGSAKPPASASEPAPLANARPAPAPVPITCPKIDPEDAVALAAVDATTKELDLDGDPTTAEASVEHRCGSPLRCAYQLYAQRDGCWNHLGATGELMSEPGCERGSAKGTFCTLSGMRLMIHGDAQEYVYPFHGAYDVEEAGTRYVPGPSKRP